MGTGNLEVLDTSAIVIVKVGIKAIDCELRTLFLWVKNGTNDGLLSVRKCTFASTRLGEIRAWPNAYELL
jgi:hypothetical protein